MLQSKKKKNVVFFDSILSTISYFQNSTEYPSPPRACEVTLKTHPQSTVLSSSSSSCGTVAVRFLHCARIEKQSDKNLGFSIFATIRHIEFLRVKDHTGVWRMYFKWWFRTNRTRCEIFLRVKKIIYKRSSSRRIARWIDKKKKCPAGMRRSKPSLATLYGRISDKYSRTALLQLVLKKK